MRRIRLILISIGVLVLAPSLRSNAQFREDAFTQQYNDDKSSMKDSVDVLFSFKDFFGGIAHKHEIKIGVMFAGSTLFVGSSQIYNKDYWKLPIVYGGIGAGIGLGCHFLDKNPTASTLSFVGAGLVWWGSLMDGVVRYKPDDFPHPGKATIYSILFPGLGQIYNKEYWKLPIYWGGLAAAYHFFDTNRVNYNRFRNIYLEATNPGSQYTGPITADVALYYRDVYRRYRDYSVLAIAAVYLLQIIDANVFSYMHDFEVADDLAIKVSPTVFSNDYQFAQASPIGFGLNVGIKF